MNKAIIKTIFGQEVIDKIENQVCPTCDKAIKIEDFRDELSVKEYTISGMCQECQDSIFGK
jgi:hypothetical protein